MAACLSPSLPLFTRRVHVLPSKTLLRLLKPTNKRPSTTTVAASIRHNNIVSLTATTHLLKPPPNPAIFLHISAFLFLVSAAVYCVLHFHHLRRRLVTSSSPHLHRPIAPPSRSPAEWEGRVRRKRELQLIPFISKASYRSYEVGQRKSGDLARIQLLVIGELVLRNGAARARLSSSFVDVTMETMIIDVISGSGHACNDSNRSDPSFGSGVLLLPEIRTDSTADLLASNDAVKETLYHSSELQRSIPAIVVVAGIMGAFAGGEIGGLEMVGFLALLSFFAYDLLWANKRKMLWSELVRINDREGFMSFLLSKKIVV